MKIINEFQTKGEPNVKRQPSLDKHVFSKNLESQQIQLKKQEIEQLMKNITLQGNKLARSRTFRDLAKFKKLIKRFLQEAVSEGFQLQSDFHFGFNGNQKLKLVKEIDAKLIELTEDVLNQERKTVNILDLIGEIKGLLINLYT